MGWVPRWSSSQGKVHLLSGRERDVDMGSNFLYQNTGIDASAPCQVEGKNGAHDLKQNVMGKDLRYLGIISLHWPKPNKQSKQLNHISGKT